MLFFKLLRESYLFAWNAVKVNRLRTVLTLLGITIGIFAVISVLTIFDSMERYVKQNLEQLGDNVLFVRKWPQFSFDSDYPWWEYWRRPEITPYELEEIQKRSMGTDFAVFVVGFSKPVKYKNNEVKNPNIVGTSHDYHKVLSIEIQDGRYFSQMESYTGRNVAVIGHEIAENLFPGQQAVGKSFKSMGRKIEVIGVIKKEGQDNLGEGTDKTVLLPVNFLNGIINIRSDRYGGAIIVKGKPFVSNEELKDELTGILRSVRKVKPGAKDNFTIEEITLLKNMMERIFRSFAIAGWFIGGFSLLVGGFGIANIMFVSVMERIKIIGIQKSLGAKKYFVLLQFLFEAVFLSLFGGIIGLFLVWIGTKIFSSAMDFTVVLSIKNILSALIVSIMIGIAAGIIPAIRAANKNPVDAIRHQG